ncbi:MAG: DUF433 domain-containing protein [Gemmataceae bacterium]|nr:DUF433 domain-containing protein [Gemmataceae bacterium]
MTPVTTSHIWLDERGVAWIDDTNIKVIEVAKEWYASGASPEEIVYQHPGCYSLGQVHAALAYYFDHEEEFNAEIKRHSEEYERLRAASLDSPVRRRLRALGNLP